MQTSSRAALSELIVKLDARAAGWWERAGDSLTLVAFARADDLPAEVADAFVEATRSVPLDRLDLGIVRAAVGGRVIVSRVKELPPDAGSSVWLNRFRAKRSVATPIGRYVASIALGDEPADDKVAQAVAETAERALRSRDDATLA
jgi:hypothetical protein